MDARDRSTTATATRPQNIHTAIRRARYLEEAAEGWQELVPRHGVQFDEVRPPEVAAREARHDVVDDRDVDRVVLQAK